jgi:hypothetical protein
VDELVEEQGPPGRGALELAARRRPVSTNVMPVISRRSSGIGNPARFRLLAEIPK